MWSLVTREAARRRRSEQRAGCAASPTRSPELGGEPVADQHAKRLARARRGRRHRSRLIEIQQSRISLKQGAENRAACTRSGSSAIGPEHSTSSGGTQGAGCLTDVAASSSRKPPDGSRHLDATRLDRQRRSRHGTRHIKVVDRFRQGGAGASGRVRACGSLPSGRGALRGASRWPSRSSALGRPAGARRGGRPTACASARW